MDVGLSLIVLWTMAGTLAATWIGYKAVETWRQWKRCEEKKWTAMNGALRRTQEQLESDFSKVDSRIHSGDRCIGILQEQMIKYSDATRAIQEQLKNATVLNVNAKTGVFTHSDESELAAERASVMGEPTVISAPKNGGQRYTFQEPGGVDAFDRPTKEEVSRNVNAETQ